MTEAPAPIFYSLPATELAEGMSTDDGQDVLGVSRHAGCVIAEVYTPRPDDPEADENNRSQPECRMYRADETIDLAVFVDTEVDGRHLDEASP